MDGFPLNFVQTLKGPQRINPNDFGDRLTLPSAPPSCCYWGFFCFFLIQISGQQLDGLLLKLVQTFMVPRGGPFI